MCDVALTDVRCSDVIESELSSLAGTVSGMTGRSESEREIVDLVPLPHDASERGAEAVISPLPGANGTVFAEWGGDEEWISTLTDPHDATVDGDTSPLP